MRFEGRICLSDAELTPRRAHSILGFHGPKVWKILVQIRNQVLSPGDNTEETADWRAAATAWLEKATARFCTSTTT